VALGQVFLLFFFGFPCQCDFTVALHTHVWEVKSRPICALSLDAHHFYPEDEGSMFFQNVETFLITTRCHNAYSKNVNTIQSQLSEAVWAEATSDNMEGPFGVHKLLLKPFKINFHKKIFDSHLFNCSPSLLCCYVP
jgi:hypothetical protein